MLNDPHIWWQPPRLGGVECILVGDINVQRRSDPELVFKHVRGTLLHADVLFGNLEGCLYRANAAYLPGKPSWQHSDASMIRALTSVRFDVVGCANNVTFGAEAILHSLQILDKAGIGHCGAGADRRAARAPAILKRGGVRFGFVQFTARVHAVEQVALPNRPGVAAFDPEHPADLAEIYEEVGALRSHVDVLVVSHHVRSTGSPAIEAYQREVAVGCVEAGADVVFGHGAHLHQGIAIWKGAPIFHCVGQLAFDGLAACHHRDGLLVRLVIRRKRITGISGLLLYRNAQNDPYFVDPEADVEGQRQLAQLRDLSPELQLSVRAGEVRIW